MQQLSFITQFLQRLKSENPKYWKIISTIGIIGAIVIGAVIGLENYGFFTVPEKVDGLLKGLDGFLVGMFFTAQQSTTDATLMDTKTRAQIADQLFK